MLTTAGVAFRPKPMVIPQLISCNAIGVALIPLLATGTLIHPLVFGTAWSVGDNVN
jgi:hypothetical protein